MGRSARLFKSGWTASYRAEWRSVTFSHSSKGRLTDRDLARFPGASLFDRLARAVCHAGCLPRKELCNEAWETARRVRRLFRGGRIVDLAAGQSVLLAHVLLILDNSSSQALSVDTTRPASCAKLHDALIGAWPRLAGRVVFQDVPLESVALSADDLVVSVHACGALPDLVLHRAASARARVAVLPCCHDLTVNDPGALSGWVDGPLAVDVMRGGAPPATRLSRSNPDHSNGDHSQESAPPR